METGCRQKIRRLRGSRHTKHTDQQASQAPAPVTEFGKFLLFAFNHLLEDCANSSDQAGYAARRRSFFMQCDRQPNAGGYARSIFLLRIRTQAEHWSQTPKCRCNNRLRTKWKFQPDLGTQGRTQEPKRSLPRP